MAQLFGPRFGFAVRLALLALVASTASVAFLWRAVTAYPSAANAPLEQPVPFSHKHAYRIDRRRLTDCSVCHR